MVCGELGVSYKLSCTVNNRAAEASYVPNLAQTGPLYSYVAANTAKAHVKVG